jgi:hypothetical protein
VLCPYGAPGDRLWVREAWGNSHAAAHASDENAGPFVYRADGESTTRTLEGRWRPSIHMPRRASRLTLEVTGVRVKRLQDISEEDALAEGIPFVPPQSDDESGVFLAPGVRQGWGWSKEIRSQDRWAPTAGIAYRVLWDSINAKRAPWDSNPWVWVVEFQRLGGAA